MAKPPLTKEKKKWAESRESTVLTGTRLNYNASQQAKYQKAILTLVRQMTEQTKKEIIKLFESETAESFFTKQKEAAAMDVGIASKTKKVANILMDKFNRLFAIKAQPIAEAMIDGAKKTSEASLKMSLRELSGDLSLSTRVIPTGIKEITQASVEENVSLIQSLPAKYFNDVVGSMMRSITSGISLATLTKQIQKFNGQTERRARNIALDQVRKAYNTFNKHSMQDLGFNKFRWVHSGGGQHPRKSHQAMSGNIYSFDDLPVINKEQVDRGYEGPIRGIPGQAINCKCTMTPVVEFEDGRIV